MRFNMTLYELHIAMQPLNAIVPRQGFAKRLLLGILTSVVLTSSVQVVPAAAASRVRAALVNVSTAERGSIATTVNDAFDGFLVPPPTLAPLPTYASRTYRMDLTAYTSSLEECDDDPFVTADGSATRDGIVATNALPFNTRIRIPSVFGDKIFTVHDRMNKRYGKRVDIWMERKEDMREFGLKRNVIIEVLEWGDNTTQWKKG